MPDKVRAVIDTNVLVSGLIYREGNPGRILAAIREGRFELISSPEINEEVLEVLNRPRIRGKYGIDQQEIFDIGAILYAKSVLVEPKQGVRVSKDPKDNKFIEAAIEGKAGYLVTGDKKDLLSLREHKGVRIVTPAEFIKVIT